jgi:tRNA uridine 5-carbamoylmethylation protein Kti12
MLYIMQGVPGSGKSTTARRIADSYNHCVNPPYAIVASTDDYFYDANGVYQFNPRKLGENHKMNLERAIDFMCRGFVVIVDNTNIHAWEAKPYVQFAVENNIPVCFVRVTGDPSWKSTHGVPEAAIEKMKKEMENLTVESVLVSRAPWEK